MKSKMNDFHKENMKKHIAFLETNASAIRKSFDMQRLTHNCGGPACSLGFATLSVAKLRPEESFTELSKRIFGIDPCSGNMSEQNIAEYMFGAKWKDVNNTPEAAAARMKAVLYSQMPTYWDYTKEFSHPIVIVPEEFKEEAKKLFVTA